MDDKAQRSSWWGDTDIAHNEAVHWEIGPLSFWLHRGVAEWRIRHGWVEQQHPSDWAFNRRSELPDDYLEAERFAVQEAGEAVHLRPRVADRAVVVRPKTSFWVQPATKTRIFISSPLWLEIATGSPATVLREYPTKRLSDTWFGSTTREGELCYALKTNARTLLENMPRPAYRMLTPVVIENLDSRPLLVERLSLPVPFLAVYGSQQGEAWSEEVHMVSAEEGDTAELDVRPGAPVEAGQASRLSEPRQEAERGHLFRAFGSLLGLEF